MDFTYNKYKFLLELLKHKKYEFASYSNYKTIAKPVILRHDIDNSLLKALEIAKIENEFNVRSTYFVLLSTDFYNIFSKSCNAIIKKMINLGHDIELHFDEQRYIINSENELERYVEYEKNIQGVLEGSVRAVSMHRPSKWILENNIQFRSLINTYGAEFFINFKYLSDSRMRWREDVVGIISSGRYKKLHILTHPFWYAQDNGNIKCRIKEYLNNVKTERYYQLKENVTKLEEILDIEEVL